MRGMTLRKRNYLIYLLCFLALNGIDFLRNTQNGDVWSAAVNGTGLVMMVLLFSACPLKRFFTKGSCIWSGCCALAVLAVILRGENSVFGVYRWTFVLAILNIWWIALMAAELARRIWIERTLKVRPGILGCAGIVLALLMTFSASGRLWPAWFLAMFAFFYVTEYSGEAYELMLNAMVDGTIVSFFLLQIFAYGFRPYDVVRYQGAFPNCNIASLHYLIVYTMVLLKLHLLEKKGAPKILKAFFFVGAAGLLDFMFLTMGRTSWMAAAAETFLYGILIIRKNWGKSFGAVIARGAGLVMAFALLFPVVFATVRYLPTILHHPVWFDGEYSEEKVHSFDPADSEKYIEMDEFLETVFGRIAGTFQSRGRSLESPFVLKASAQENERETNSFGNQYEVIEKVGPEGMDESMNIRLSIYAAYIRDLNWFGHSEKEGHYQFSDIDYFSWHAQNVWLQVAYSYGISAGIVFLAITVLLFKKHFRSLRLAGDDPYAVFPFFLCLVFFLYGLLELDWNVGQLPLFLLFFIQHPGFGGKAVSEKQTY